MAPIALKWRWNNLYNSMKAVRVIIFRVLAVLL
jgi:hypothetical protein